jgi:nucleoside-diphosphate-sugar epimerase
MRVLVTGGAGFIGSHLVDRLVGEGYRVRVVDNLSSGSVENLRRHVDSNAVELMIGDLKDPYTALRSVENADVVFHFAANPEVRVSSVDPGVHFNENVVATFNLLEPRMRHGVVWDFIVKLRGNPVELEVLGDGSQVRSYMHVGDAVEATITAWTRGGEGYQVYNVASEDWIAVDEVADIVVEAMGLKGVRKKYKPVLHGVGWPGDVKRIALRIDRLKSIGFKPRMSSREAVRTAVEEILEELKANP